MSLDNRKASRMLAVLLRVCFHRRTACRRVSNVRSVHFDCRKAGRRLEEVRKSIFTIAKRIGGLPRFVA